MRLWELFSITKIHITISNTSLEYKGMRGLLVYKGMRGQPIPSELYEQGFHETVNGDVYLIEKLQGKENTIKVVWISSDKSRNSE